MTTNTHRIINGPSKMDIMLSLFDDDCPCGHRRTVTFTVIVNDGYVFRKADFKVHINLAKRIIDSGTVFDLSGVVDIKRPYTFSARFSTTNRNGNFTFH